MIPTSLPAVPDELARRGVSLRLRDDADADFLRDVYVAYREEEVAATGWPQEMRLSFLHDQYRMQTAHYDRYYDGAAWGVIEVAGERAGRLYLLRTKDEIRIVDIAFMPPYRNQGFGSGLLRAVQNQAAALGLGSVSIHVEQNNPALRLYERLGFAREDDAGVYYLLRWPVPLN